MAAPIVEAAIIRPLQAELPGTAAKSVIAKPRRGCGNLWAV